MKRRIKNFLSIFGIGKKQSPLVINMGTYNSQDYRLRSYMREAGLAHGDRVKADIGPVQIIYAGGKGVLFFCQTRSVCVKEVLSLGDGGAIPVSVQIKGLRADNLARRGNTYYNLKNVTLYSNGSIQIIANEETTLEPVWRGGALNSFTYL